MRYHAAFDPTKICADGLMLGASTSVPMPTWTYCPSRTTDYRRNRVPGGTYFFTVNLRDRKSRLLIQHIAALRDAVRQAQHRAPFHIDAWVILPDSNVSRNE